MLRNRSTAEFAVLVCAHILLGLLFLTTGYIRPDSVGVVSILRSAALDQDLLFFNEWARFGMIQNGLTWFKEVTALGTLANHWGPGTSLLAAPGYVAALLVSGWPADGFDGLPGMVLAWTSVALTCVTLALANQTLRKNDGLSAPMRSLVLAAILFGTPLFWYTFRLPLGTHAAGTFCIGVAAFLMRRGLAEHGYAIGLLLGLATVTRIQHILLLAVVFFAALVLRLPRVFLAKLVAGAVPPLLVQAVAWQVIYGTPFGPLVSGANLTGSTWAPFHSTNFMAVLFSPYHGLLSWAPVILLALAGWLLALRGENRNIAAIFLAMFVVTLVANASFDRYFWGGLSFGQRRFVDLAIPFAFGLGWFSAAFKRLAVPLTVLATAWTMALTMAALSGSVSLSRYVSGPMLLQSVTTSIPSLERIRAPITNAGMILTSLAAIAILGFLIAALWLFRARWQAIATVYLLVCALTFAAMGPGTRARIDSNLQRFAISRAAAARFGPLTDQRQLLLDEIEYLERTNRIAAAEKTRREIAAIDQMLRELR